MIELFKILIINILLFNWVFTAEPITGNESSGYSQEGSAESLGRIGDYGYPGNPLYDRAKGYLLKGKVKNAVTNHLNIMKITINCIVVVSGSIKKYLECRRRKS